MLTKQEILQKIEKHKEEIKALGVNRLVLFGSYAKGKQKKESDVDFLVEFAPGRGLYKDYVQLLQLLRKNLHKKIDLVKPSLVREELRESILRGTQVEAKI
ncbi:nucleotidyltransferase domain-containing protein [Candidatus Woesearchaeota archaeon]|nr:nucleotidyltransferase domain-containing protein [Candidatus Woesearchaeota archaeon]